MAVVYPEAVCRSRKMPDASAGKHVPDVSPESITQATGTPGDQRCCDCNVNDVTREAIRLGGWLRETDMYRCPGVSALGLCPRRCPR